VVPVLTLQQLRTFCAVLEERSFNKAAERLYTTQPSVSQQIAALEQYFGVKLFKRVGKHFRITPDGYQLYKLAAQVLEIVDCMPLQLQKLRDLACGSLNIGASTLTGSYVLPAVLRTFQEKYPGVEISLHTGFAFEMINAVKKNEVDIALVGEDPTWKGDPELEVRPLGKDSLSLILWPEHPLATRTHLSASDLASEVFIQSRQGSAMRSMVERYMSSSGIQPRRQISMGNLEAVKRAVEQHLGVAIVSTVSIQRECQDGSLVRINLEGLDKVQRDFLLIWPRARELSTAEMVIAELVEEYLKTLPRK